MSISLRLPALSVVCIVAFLTAHGRLAAQSIDVVQLDVPYVPTPQAVVDRMLELAEIKSGDYLIDLGSGDGRIPITAAKRHGIRAFGVDLDPVRIREANDNAREAGVEGKVEFRQQDLFDTAIADADVLTMYLLPVVNLKLRPRLLYELKPGSRIVSHSFRLGEWEPDHYEEIEDSDIFLWIVPAKVDGRWRVEGPRPFTISLTQTFQKIEGTATIDGRTVPLVKPVLRGARLSFEVDGRRYAGRVDNFTIVSDDGVPDAESGWRAMRN
jgi:hypothetical protein